MIKKTQKKKALQKLEHQSYIDFDRSTPAMKKAVSSARKAGASQKEIEKSMQNGYYSRKDEIEQELEDMYEEEELD